VSAVVAPGCRVSFHYRLSLASGEEFESTFGDEPMMIEIGSDEFVPALEFLLTGLKTGDRERYEIGAGEAVFGYHDEELVQEIDRADFPAGAAPEAGMMFVFATPMGEEVPGVVQELSGDKVLVDFNHPLIGHDLVFEAEILDVQPATA